MLNDKQKLLKNISIIKDKRNARIKNYDRKNRFKLFWFGLLISIIAISLTYLLSDYSNISSIICVDNIYLNNDELIELSGLSLNDKYLFVNTDKIEDTIKKSEIIEDCIVTKRDDRSVMITVSEKKMIGYCFENNENVLVLFDDTRISLNKDNIHFIENVPLIEGFSKDQILLIENNFKELDFDIINEISEIHYYPELKFQDHEVIMRDGNYIFASVYGLKLINKYYDVVSSYHSDKKECYYVEDISGNFIMSACPWVPEPDEKNSNNVEIDNQTDDISTDEDLN